MASQQNQTPQLCEGGCGFTGNPATNDLCSVCYKIFSGLTEIKAMPEKAEVGEKAFDLSCLSSILDDFSSETTAKTEDAVPMPPAPVIKKRCEYCKKKVGLMPFMCECGCTFCGAHRYPEKHECEFNFKNGRDAIVANQPLMLNDKLKERI